MVRTYHDVLVQSQGTYNTEGNCILLLADPLGEAVRQRVLGTFSSFFFFPVA